MAPTANYGGVCSEEVEGVVQRVMLYLDENTWVAVDLEGRGERPRHQHPPGCPKRYKAVFGGQSALSFAIKGKFTCGNASCRRKWTSAMAMLLLSVRPSSSRYRLSITALEQGCQQCGRDVYAVVYHDEAERVAAFLTVRLPSGPRGHQQVVQAAAYMDREYPESTQRGSHMRRPHDKNRCAACRAGLH